MFLAGGLSENKYLEMKVRDGVREDYGSRIMVELAEEAYVISYTMISLNLTCGYRWSAVVKGAVLTGLGLGVPVPPKVSNCPRHYGISVAQEYKEWQHRDQQLVHDVFHGRQMARDPIIGMIRKGDLICGDKAIIHESPINCKFTAAAHQAGNRTVCIRFVATNLDELPSRLSELPRGNVLIVFSRSWTNRNLGSNEVADIEIPLNKFYIAGLTAMKQANGGGTYYQVTVTVTLTVLRNVTVEIFYMGGCIKAFSTNQ